MSLKDSEPTKARRSDRIVAGGMVHAVKSVPNLEGLEKRVGLLHKQTKPKRVRRRR